MVGGLFFGGKFKNCEFFNEISTLRLIISPNMGMVAKMAACME